MWAPPARGAARVWSATLGAAAPGVGESNEAARAGGGSRLPSAPEERHGLDQPRLKGGWPTGMPVGGAAVAPARRARSGGWRGRRFLPPAFAGSPVRDAGP